MPLVCTYTGRSRDVFKISNDFLLMNATDKVHCGNKHIGDILGKGELLKKMSEFWFNNTRHIINNHLLTSKKSESIVINCKPFAIVMVIRGYITGNTSTSLWTHYNNGVREYCGLTFPDGLHKNQRLNDPIVTPTTKGKVAKPISPTEIVSDNWMTQEEYDFVQAKALELFEFGQKVADTAGFILVDTKYEFGKTNDGEIILIDELHTCDSSHYWIKETYLDNFIAGKEPDKHDKDCLRDWVNSVCHPSNGEIPKIPQEVIDRTYNSYKMFYDVISSADLQD